MSFDLVGMIDRIRIPRFASQQERLNEAFQHGHLSTGPHLEELTAYLQATTGARYVVLTSSGFSALFASLMATFRPESRIAIPCIGTCFAIDQAVRTSGMVPSHADVEVETGTLPASVFNTEGIASAIVPSFFGIRPGFCRTGAESGTFIEDAAQSFFSINKNSLGARITTLSFFPTKMANGIDGGGILTDDPDIYESLSDLTSYDAQSKPDGRSRWNLKMPNIHAAFLLGTLAHSEEIKSTVVNAHARLSKLCSALDLHSAVPGVADIPSRFVANCRSKGLRDDLVAELNRRGIAAAVEYLWLADDTTQGDYPVGRQWVDQSFSLPLHADIREDEVDVIEQAMLEILK